MHFTTFITALFVATLATSGALADCVGVLFYYLSVENNEPCTCRIATKTNAVPIPLGAVMRVIMFH